MHLPYPCSVPPRISYAQNGEDVRIWHAFGPRSEDSDLALTYVDVGANEPWRFSLTASLYRLGWRGVLVEADPDLAAMLRRDRPEDHVVQGAAAAEVGSLTFYRVPGTGLGTLDRQEADRARARGFDVKIVQVDARPLDRILADSHVGRSGADIHVLSIDVEGAEASVLAGLALTDVRPWVLCIEAVEPGTSTPSHLEWEPHVLRAGYRYVAFDGVNRWYVSEERADVPVSADAGAPAGTTIAEAIATPFHVLDIGEHGWVTEDMARLRERDNRAFNRAAWQRELIMNDRAAEVPRSEYERQIHELRSALVQVEGSRTFALSRSLAKVGKRGLHLLQRARRAIPAPINARIIRERHLRHVTVNMGHLTDPGYLGDASADQVTWIAASSPEEPGFAPRPPLPPGIGLEPITDEVDAIRAWLTENPFDSDSELDARMDNHDDEVGRVRAALRTRLRLLGPQTSPGTVAGNRIAIDARALQSPAFGNRGIGRFASSVLRGARSAVGDDRITLIVDRGLHPLPAELAGECTQVTRIKESEAAQFCVFLEPSPMTHSADPVIPLLHSGVRRVAVVFDFIPMHYPTIYLRHAAARAEYATNLDALRLYDEYICISNAVRQELPAVIGASNAPDGDVVVAWPRDVLPAGEPSRGSRARSDGPIVLATGDEPRKNTFGGLAGIAAATSDEDPRDVLVLGMAGQETRVHHWSIAAAMRPGEARTLGRVSDEELSDLLAAASCVIVPSFDEGLSLPVIEALRAGTPVVASAIPAHRELIGSGAFLCDPSSPRSIARAIRRARGRSGVWERQARALAGHSHAFLEDVVSTTIRRYSGNGSLTPHGGSVGVRSSRLSVGVATPWKPQRTGVADFSTAVFRELAALVDLTVYTTGDAQVQAKSSPHRHIAQRSVEEILADPSVAEDHDAFLSVIGNSHYHLPFVQLLSRVDAIAIAHDTRMVEFYMALRGRGGAEQVMLTTGEPSGPRGITPALDDQIDDMRLLQNAGFWEVAQRASHLVLHSPSAAPRIMRETGRPVSVLPFANQRVPRTDSIGPGDRRDARRRLGLDTYPEGTIHLGSFGYVDVRTKMTDVVVETAAWLRHWGHPVALHLVGAANEQQVHQLEEQARRSGVETLHITGFQTDEQFRDWLLAVDVGIQLRISPLLGVSGPLSDLAAFGTSAVASAGLCVDVDTPAYIHRLPDAVSPVMVAEAVENVLAETIPMDVREQIRVEYLSAKSPARYARLLLDVIEATR